MLLRVVIVYTVYWLQVSSPATGVLSTGGICINALSFFLITRSCNE